MITDIQSKKEFLIKNKENFGIRNDIPGEKFISICARNNKYIATKSINSKIPLPSINGIISNCHGIVDCAGEIDTSYASFRVTHSKEEPIKPDESLGCSCKTNCICPPGTKRKCTQRNQVPGSISFVPSVAGLMVAGEIIKDIIEK